MSTGIHRRLIGLSVFALIVGGSLGQAGPTPSSYASTPSWQCSVEVGDADSDGTPGELLTTTPCLLISKTTDLSPIGEQITVQGYNFTPNPPATNGTRAPLAGKFGGVYVVVNKYPDNWQPSLGGTRPSFTTNQVTNWGVLAEDLATIGGASRGGIVVSPDGSFSTSFSVQSEWSGMPTSGNFGIYTFAGSGAVVQDFELAVPLEFTPSTAPRMALASNPAQPLPDQAFTLEALVNPDEAAGTLTLSGEGVATQTATLEDGVASFSVPPTPGGLYSWQIAFNPDQPLLYSARSLTFSLAIDDGTGIALTVGTPTESGFMKWGVKSTFRSYVTGSIAKGSITTSEAGRQGSEFLFGQSQPVIDTDTWEQVAYRGAVTFRGHGGLMDVTLANPRITKTSDSLATLSVDYRGSRVTIARLDPSRGSKSQANGFLSYSSVPTNLLAGGESVFSFDGSSFYQAGETLDPVSFSIGAVAGVLTDTVVDSYLAPEPTFDADSGLFASLANLEGACEIADATLAWGFKESFRSYVSGAIAKGDWQVAEGAQYSTPTFTFAHESGSMNVENPKGLLKFRGLVNFTGHQGVLDVSVSDPVLAVESDNKATLYLTFEGQTMEGEKTSAANIRFATVDLGSGTIDNSGGQLFVTGAESVLTAEGAKALGTYEAGSAMDPISFTVLAGLDCAAADAQASSAGGEGVDGSAGLPTGSSALSLGVTGLVGLGGVALGAGGVWLGRTLLRGRGAKL